MARPEPLKEKDVLRVVSLALERAGRVIPSRHFWERGRKRHFDISDAIKVLTEATEAKTVWNEKSQSWNYDMTGKDMERNELTVRLAITEDQKGVILVTGF